MRETNLGVLDKITDTYIGGDAPIDHPLNAVKIDFQTKFIDEKAIKTGDFQLFFTPNMLSIVPTIEHKIVNASGDIFDIISVATKAPAEVTIAYVIHCRH